MMNIQIESFANTLFRGLNGTMSPANLAMDLLKIFGGENAFNAAGLADALSQLRQNDPAMAGAVASEIDRQLSPLHQGQLAREGAAFEGVACESAESAPMRAGDRNSAWNADYPKEIAKAIERGSTRVGPVPGWQEPAVKNSIGPNGKPYSDGKFSIDGKEKYRLNQDGTGKPHKGIDIPAKTGDLVYVAASGTVTKVRDGVGYGNLVLVDHKDGTSTLYAHLSSQDVKEGHPVTIGQVIGKVGTDGNGVNKGDHLHFEAFVTQKGDITKFTPRLDPSKWIKAGGY